MYKKIVALFLISCMAFQPVTCYDTLSDVARIYKKPLYLIVSLCVCASAAAIFSKLLSVKKLTFGGSADALLLNTAFTYDTETKQYPIKKYTINQIKGLFESSKKEKYNISYDQEKKHIYYLLKRISLFYDNLFSGEIGQDPAVKQKLSDKQKSISDAELYVRMLINYNKKMRGRRSVAKRNNDSVLEKTIKKYIFNKNVLSSAIDSVFDFFTSNKQLNKEYDILYTIASERPPVGKKLTFSVLGA